MVTSRGIIAVGQAAAFCLLCSASLLAQGTPAVQTFSVGVPPPPEIAGVAAGKAIVGFGPEMERIVKNAPFSAQASTTTTQVLGDGNRIVQTSEMVLARDSDGRSRREMSVDKLGPWSTDATGHVVFIRDPVAGVIYVLQPDGQHAMKSVVHVSGDAPEMPAIHKKMMEQGLIVKGEHVGTESRIVTRNGTVESVMIGGTHEGPAQKETLGDQTIEGVRATGTRETRTIAAGAIGNDKPIDIVSETWFSPDLQIVVLSKHSDPRVGETVYKLTNIQLAEPDPTLFQVPASYTVQDEPKANLRFTAKPPND